MRKLNVKRWGILWLSVCLLGVGGCAGTGTGQQAGQEASSEEKISLYDRGLAVINKMEVMAESGGYIEMMTSSPDVLEVVKEMRDVDCSRPERVLKVTIPEDAVDALLEMADIAKDSVPEELKPDLRQRLMATIPTTLSAQEGTEALAAMSMVTATNYFIDQDLSENTLYIYLYDGRCSGAVIFSVHEEGIVSAEGRFIVNSALAQAGASEEFDSLLSAVTGLTGIEISEVPVE